MVNRMGPGTWRKSLVRRSMNRWGCARRCRVAHHERVNHGGIDFRVAEQFLDGADVVAGFQKMRGKGMAESVTAHRFGYLRQTDRCAHAEGVQGST